MNIIQSYCIMIDRDRFLKNLAQGVVEITHEATQRLIGPVIGTTVYFSFAINI